MSRIWEIFVKKVKSITDDWVPFPTAVNIAVLPFLPDCWAKLNMHIWPRSLTFFKEFFFLEWFVITILPPLPVFSYLYVCWEITVMDFCEQGEWNDKKEEVQEEPLSCLTWIYFVFWFSVIKFTREEFHESLSLYSDCRCGMNWATYKAFSINITIMISFWEKIVAYSAKKVLQMPWLKVYRN